MLLYYHSLLPDDVAILLNGVTARDDDAAVVLIVPDLDGLVKPGTRQAAVRSVPGHPAGAPGGDDVVVLHEVHIDLAGDDTRAVSIAGEGALDFRASRVVAAEVAVQLHIVLLTVDDDAVGLVVAEHQLAHVGAMAEAAVEHARQHAALAAVVAIVPLHAPYVHLPDAFIFFEFLLLHRKKLSSSNRIETR